MTPSHNALPHLLNASTRRERDEEGNVLFLGPDGAILNPGTNVKAHHHYGSKKTLTEQEVAERAAYRHWGHIQKQAWAHIDGRQTETERSRKHEQGRRKEEYKKAEIRLCLSNLCSLKKEMFLKKVPFWICL
ncbi:unnamed protein product [Sympodiomycopsis kandeliae]